MATQLDKANFIIRNQEYQMDAFSPRRKKALAAVLNLLHNNISWQDE